MEGEVKLNEVSAVLESLEYPVTKGEIEAEIADLTVLYADGEESLARVLERVNQSQFESAEALEAEILSNVSIGAVGEPGQSEGEG
ncbi:Uncharacterized protein HSRCO_0833 [Halanaeroarchaeum sp. HSR-CO]|uniref:DUF5789 family protein n=1 Tax=Halanaeroarchaeum sp. HSR-CO TaxID=2866382 RepID=UPI00217E9E50|nr:DUF5789 family protein [Halanaeroarchaeum sp. HSR-CO]UWG47123.1 Uncharacterized protein HSRCO_0833 [Halanaeroarchaeum sp. HSR-CO]